MQHQREHSKLDAYQSQQRSAIVTGQDGKLYRIEELSPTELRHQLDYQRSRQANQFGWTALAIGGVFAGIAVLMVLGAILAAATRPPAPVVNPNCWIGCSGNSN